MWRNYLIVGIRALLKSRAYAFINIVGLAIGLAACLIILTFVRYEFGYDAWLPNAENTYQFQTIYLPSPTGGRGGTSQTTAYVAEAAIKKDFPQIERAVWVSSQATTILKNGQPATVKKPYVTDGALFDVLRVPFVRGNPTTALDDPHSLVLSETEARDQFGDVDPIGRTLTIVDGGTTTDYRVTGVFKDLPKNSTLDMTMVVRIDPGLYFQKSPQAITSWHWQNGSVYARVKPGTDIAAMEAQLPAWEKRNVPDDAGSTPKSNPGDFENWHFANIRDLHLSKSFGQGRANGDRQSIITFGVVALLILAMACMNFTNLATARASQRAREVALRKVLGATRGQLVGQFLGESMMVAAIAMLIALGLAELGIHPLNAFLDADMSFRYLGAHGVLLPVILLTLLVGLAGGLYPAFFLSRFEPARILKANKSAADAEGNGRLRSLLVITQFAVSIGLIACTAVVYGQTVYARNVDAGFKRDGLLQLNGISRPQVDSVAPTLLQELRKQPGIADAARVSLGIATGNNTDGDVNVPGQKPVDLGIYGVDTHAFDTLGMKLLAGRNFSESIGLDNSTLPNPPDLTAENAFVARGTNVILSEQAAQRLGFATPQAAIGKQVQLSFTSLNTGLTTATVVGVVSDVRYRTIRQPIQPILYYYQTDGFNQMMVRFSGDPVAARATVERVWKRSIADLPLNARFVADITHDLYNADEKRAQLFGMFALLAVLIGCLGLFGLAAFTAERRTKEIGIRKVLGARTRDILQLLVWQFSKPVLIANVIAWPVAWWMMREWLNTFDIRMSLGLTPFLMAGGLALLVAIVTIASHAWRVAQQSPVKALRYE
ncbi:FtsX-like permease family protein [Sphingomonas panacisoli]|uniref:FtsX-like permease family protein n=1 Tax=Sphingomonas panacisoli TaxID=1813879 RepID=A0A5B8LJ95_9SPHN|nr:ABC transporter permease [Sphingomonas panacisoli]QDZ08288.1 FtsX-like permease family protein [Sphingomonas panacisoli]